MSNVSIDYVLIEAVKKSDVEVDSKQAKNLESVEVISGLFSGIKTILSNDNAVAFLLIQKTDAALLALNTKIYNILSVRVGYKAAHQEHTFYMNTEEDQKGAFEELVDILSLLVEKNMVTEADKDVVDIASYVNTPNMPKDPKNKTSGYSNSSSSSSQNNNYACGSEYDHLPGYRNNNYQNTYERKVSFFMRKSNKPKAEQLKALKLKIDKIKEGKYEPPKPVFEVTEPTKTKIGFETEY